MKRLKRKDLLLLANKLLEKLPDPSNYKEHYESFLGKKSRKSLKQSEIITYQPKTFYTVDIKSDITEHPKSSQKLPKTIRKAEKEDSNSSLYSDTEKSENFLDKKIKNKVKQSKISNLCIKKCCEDKHVDLLLIGEGEEKHYVLIKDFNTFIYNHTLHHGRKLFCCYCLQAFRTAEKLKCHIKDSFKINGKQTIKIHRKSEHIKLKIFEMRIKSPFMIYTDFEIILVPEYNGK